MRSTNRFTKAGVRSTLLSTTVLAGAVMLAAAPAIAQDTGAMETVTVTGYRASLQDSTNAKRNAVSFSDTVFAEDIGKFPDTNIAEALNRVPGVTITRDINGEGFDVQIRGLGAGFTKVLLNGAQVAMASTGTTDSQGTNREVDLNMLPTELFTQLTVDKSPRADLLEGGAAGTVNMRTLRPFDNPGMHFTYSLQGTQPSNDHTSMGPRGTVVFSDTRGPFGLLVGLTGQINHQYTTGYETIGWTTLKMNAAQCGAGNTCNSIGGGNASIPTTVPTNVTTGGLVPGETVDSTLLSSLNPGLTMPQLSNALFPRLGRYMYEKGTRSRYNGVISAEYRPTDALHFYVDFIGGRLDNNLDRSDMDWVGRFGSLIPENVKVNSNGVVTSGTFANSQWFLEARPYKEKEDFLSLNPGMDWQVNDMLHVDLQANVSRSHFFRDSPSFLVVTPMSSQTTPGALGQPVAPTGGVYVKYGYTGGIPTEATNIDLNNPANFQWQGGRVNIQDEKRYVYNNGVHGDVEYGGDVFNVKAGFAYDEAYRSIKGYDNSQEWQNAVCGDNPNVVIPTPNSQPSCMGYNIVGPALTGTAAPTGDPRNPALVAAGIPTYFLYNAAGNGITGQPGTYPGAPIYYGYGQGSTAGGTPLAYQGSLIPQTSLAGYMHPGPAGFVSADYAKIFKATNYYGYDYPNAPLAGGTNTGASGGVIDEKDWGLYGEVNGKLQLGERDLKYNIGLRWVQTRQYSGGYISQVNPNNVIVANCPQPNVNLPNGNACTTGSTPVSLPTGSQYPNQLALSTAVKTYQSWLPAINLVYEVADDFQVRAALSRTMTRPDPFALLPGASFGDPSAATASQGNPGLKPYYSNNIDIGFDLFTGQEGYLGATFFRKGITGFTGIQNVTEPFSYLSQYGITFGTLSPTQQAALISRGCVSDATCPTTITVQQTVNASGMMTINGMEFDWVQPLDFLLADYGLKGFGVSANVTIVDQKGTGQAPAIALGVAPYTYNIQAYYENYGASVRFSYNFNAQEYSGSTNQNGICLPSSSAAGCPQGAYLFTAPYGQLDFSSSYKLSHLFGDLPSDPEVTFDIQNVTKSKLKSYFQYPSAPFTYYNQGSLYLFGIRGSF